MFDHVLKMSRKLGQQANIGEGGGKDRLYIFAHVSSIWRLTPAESMTLSDIDLVGDQVALLLPSGK